MIERVTDAHTAAVVRAYLAREGAHRHHLVAYLSGAHAYGFPSPDSDVDLKCVHVAPTRDLVGLVPRDGSPGRIEVVDGVEVDYGSNEVGGVLRGALRGDGNYLERLLGACAIVEDEAAMRALRPRIARCVSRRVHAHYRGFAYSQRQAALAAEAPAIKKVLYVLRTALTGAHLLATGEVVTDLSVLAAPLGFPAALELIAAKRAGERATLEPAAWPRWRDELDRAFAVLDEARARSPLPDEPPEAAVAEVEAWLIELRRARF